MRPSRQGWFDCPVLGIADARALWQPAGPYLNTATFGLPATPAWDALEQALADWRHGRTSWEGWCDATDRAREHFANLVGTSPARVATGASVSYLVALVASGIPDGSRVLVPEVDFSSLTWPFLAQGRFEISTAPLEQLAGAINRDTDVVAFSADLRTGTVADIAAAPRRCARCARWSTRHTRSVGCPSTRPASTRSPAPRTSG
jgi:selenocysteine lyase/cysteine desulfurase